MTASDYDPEYAERQLARARNPLRRAIKNFYLKNILRHVRGPTVDFGCGAGQLLERLPPGSLGLEVNPSLVQALRARGLNVQLYHPETDGLSLGGLASGAYRSLVMAHVLEHFEQAACGLRTILESCRRLGIERLILVLPCEKGYAFDPTHRTFVDRGFLEANALCQHAGYAITHMSHFPSASGIARRHFVFNEFTVVYERGPDGGAGA